MARLPRGNDDSITFLDLGDKYTVSQFQELARTVSRTSTIDSRKLERYSKDKVKVSPRQEIYKSMLREIQSSDQTPMSSLVHKASGILRLDHYKKHPSKNHQKVLVSWDIDGRRVLTYEGRATALMREADLKKPAKKKLLESLNNSIYGLDFQNFKKVSKDYDRNFNGSTDCDVRLTSPISKVWEDYIETGDVSKLWDSKQEAIIPRSKRRSSKHRSKSRASHSSYTSESKISDGSAIEPRPSWKSSVIKPSRERIKSWESTKTLWGSPNLMSSSATDQSSQEETRKAKSRRTHSYSSFSSKSKRDEEEDEKVDRVQHICVVNGSVVSFKDFGFDNFTNWFGDESVLEANQQRCQPKFHLELDLADVENKDVKIRMLDGFKLEIEARRKIPGSKKPLRMKEYLHVPKGYRPEDLLMCRTKAGKLVVEELTPEPFELPLTNSKIQLSKSKSNIKQQQERINTR